MRTVFLDTVGLLAIWDDTDQWHAAAEPVFRQLLSARFRLVSTTLVFLECGNAAARHSFRPNVNELRKELLQFGNLIEPTQEEIEAAWVAYDRGESGNAGIIDHVSFVVMRRLSLTEAFTHNAHFQAAGFVTLF